VIPPFSLFDGDLVNRSFARIGLGPRKTWHVAARAVLLSVATYGPMAVAAWWQGLYTGAIDARNFFADYAAYAQFLIALPLFVVAERIVARNTREAALDLIGTGVIGADDLGRLAEAHARVRRRRLSRRPDWLLGALAYWLAYMTFRHELWTTPVTPTWHTGGSGILLFPGGLTAAGAWAMLVALPLLNYWWLRMAWKIVIWTRYLWDVSRLRLRLIASHPDQTGGIGFISDVQAKFALVLFAYGISNVAAVIAYKVGIEKASLWLPPVWGPAVGFVVIAPLLFTLPLFAFTRQLYRAKRRALAAFRDRVRDHADAFEARWLGRDVTSDSRADLPDVAGLNNLAAVFGRITQMRVVPFDLRSFSQLLGSTLGSVATALPIVRFEANAKDWLDFIARLFGR
jgi:hypothetical protein